MADRDPKTGKFAEGNKASPGRPPRKVEGDLQAMLTEQTRQRWQQIVKAAIDQAISGNVYAMRFLAEYTIGKPPTTLNINATDAKLLGDVLKLLEKRNITASDLFNDLLQELAVMDEADDEQS